jgi:hypothetical protein
MRLRLMLLGAVLLGACVWRSYERVMTIHLDVLEGMLDKIVSIADAGRRPTPNDITEMLYPLERGQLFLLQHRDHEREEAYRRFAGLLTRYRELASAVDDARTDAGRWEALRARLHGEADALRREVARVRAALRSPSRGAQGGTG